MGFLKKLFGKQEEKKQSKSFLDFDEMSRQTFYRYEAAYRHQETVIPRFKSEIGIPLRDILKRIVPDVVSKVDSMTEFRTIQLNSGDVKSRHFSNAEEILAYDLFWNVSYKGDDGDIYPITGRNITLTIRTKGENVPSYMVIFVRGTAIGFEETYIRITVMIPNNVGSDDLRSMQSGSIPTMTSFLIACSKKDNPIRFAEYEEAERRVWDCLKAKKRLRDNTDMELFHGIGEFYPYSHYIGYGKHLYENDRYYDAYVMFMRAVRYLRANPKDDMSEYFNVCKFTAKCLVELGYAETAGYYYGQAHQGGEDVADEFCDYLANLGDVRALSISQNILLNAAEKYGNHEDWPESIKEKHFKIVKAYIDVCNHNSTILNEASYKTDMTIGFILNRLLNVSCHNVSEMNVITSNGEIVSVDGKEAAWNESIYRHLNVGTTITLPYSCAHYDTEYKKDKSCLCSASSIIIYVDKASPEKDLVRVNIMIPNFINNDDKQINNSANNPIGVSFIMSSEESSKLSNERDIDIIYNYAQNCFSQHRYVEAINACEYLYRILTAEFMSLSDERKAVLYDVAYIMGYCYEDMLIHERAIFYLEYATAARVATYIQEHINAMVNSKDPFALGYIRKALNTEVNADPESEGYKFHYAFLKRREAYVLIDQKKYAEAEILLKELLENPSCKDFAENELKYIKHLRS